MCHVVVAELADRVERMLAVSPTLYKAGLRVEAVQGVPTRAAVVQKATGLMHPGMAVVVVPRSQIL